MTFLPPQTSVSAAIRAAKELAACPGLEVRYDVPLSSLTRFGIGGPADLVIETDLLEAFQEALRICREANLPHYLLGEGSNLIASDTGYRGIILRWTACRLEGTGRRILADAGASLQDLVDFSIARGLKGLESLAGIPGSTGAAIYGNAGAFGHSISERVVEIHFLDGVEPRRLNQEQCYFQYRESLFKQHKNWYILRVELELEPADPAELRRTADDIARLRNDKFPPGMKCAGSIFKNLLAAELPHELLASVPPSVVREGKVPAAYFLEQAGAKNLRQGGIRVAAYHANLLYNEGGGTAADLIGLIRTLKQRVAACFGIRLEEEVQYLGEFPEAQKPKP